MKIRDIIVEGSVELRLQIIAQDYSCSVCLCEFTGDDKFENNNGWVVHRECFRA